MVTLITTHVITNIGREHFAMLIQVDPLLLIHNLHWFIMVLCICIFFNPCVNDCSEINLTHVNVSIKKIILLFWIN